MSAQKHTNIPLNFDQSVFKSMLTLLSQNHCLAPVPRIQNAFESGRRKRDKAWQREENRLNGIFLGRGDRNLWKLVAEGANVNHISKAGS
jgi:hypothetical protein